MPKIILSGLAARGDDCRVSVFRANEFGTANAEFLLDVKPDNNDIIEGDLPDNLIGTEIVIVVIDLKFKYQNITTKVDERGVFHAFSFEKDYAYIHNTPENLSDINTTKLNSEGQQSLHDPIRDSRSLSGLRQSTTKKQVLVAFHLIFRQIAVLFSSNQCKNRLNPDISRYNRLSPTDS